MSYIAPGTARRQWCAALAKLVSPSFPADAARALVDMLPAMQHLPDALFTPETLGYVAMWPRRQSVPAFNEIAAALSDYRRTFIHERPRALPAPRHEGRAPPDEAEIAYVRELIEGLLQDLAAARVEREVLDPGPVLRPMADVTAKGEALTRIRASSRRVMS